MNLPDQPISGVQWIHRDRLSANLYNPNRVAPPEMELLKTSILTDGWLFPILVFGREVDIPGITDNKDRDKHTIVDGFHRYTVSGDPEVYALTDGYVPVIIIDPADPLATTVRMNRAKGTHAVLKMADIVLHELKAGKSLEDICITYGMESEEVVRLANTKGIAKTDIITGRAFGKSWRPE